MHHLIGAAEIARLLGVTRQGVSHIAKTDEKFPAPVAIISGVRVWETEAVQQWARQTGRLDRGEKI